MIVFKDNHIIVANKIAPLPTQPPPEGGDSLETRVKAWLKRESGKAGNVYLHAIHRIDKPVTGLVLFAKTEKALQRLQKEMREGKIKRGYLAEVEGVWKTQEGTITSLVDGKEATLLFRQMGPHILEIELVTGRYHQIRAQLGEKGHPIVGDIAYGAKREFSAIHLHSAYLAFTHPVTKEPLLFRSSPPWHR